MRYVVVAMGAAALTSCSVLLSHFHECSQDSDCPAGRVCQSSYCVVNATPPGCEGVLADAGIPSLYGATDAGNAVPLGVLMNISKAVPQLHALFLAVDEINQLGVRGRPFVLRVCDTQGDATLINTQATWLQQGGVPAIIVSNTAAVLAVYETTVQAGTLLMAASATSTEIEPIGNVDGGVRLVWRTAPSDAIQSLAIVQLLLGTAAYDAGVAGVSSVGMLYVDDPYGQGLAAPVLQALPAATHPFKYTRDGDVSASLALLDAAQPQVSIMVAYQEDAPRIIDAGQAYPHLSRASGHRWFFTDSAFNPTLISQSPPGTVEGFYGTVAAPGAGAAYSLFRGSYESKYGVDPNNYALIANFYDAAYVLALASASADGQGGTLTGEALAEGLTHLSQDGGLPYEFGVGDFNAAVTALYAGQAIDISGASGPLHFNPTTGEAPAPIELWQVSDGGFSAAAILYPGP